LIPPLAFRDTECRHLSLRDKYANAMLLGRCAHYWAEQAARKERTSDWQGLALYRTGVFTPSTVPDAPNDRFSHERQLDADTSDLLPSSRPSRFDIRGCVHIGNISVESGVSGGGLI